MSYAVKSLAFDHFDKYSILDNGKKISARLKPIVWTIKV